jgi:hypothetical protein
MATDLTLSHDEVVDLAPAYVLGALERGEEAAVAEHLRTCAEPHPEMAELGSVVPYLADAVPQVEPPASLRAKILSAAASDLAARQGADVATAPAPTQTAPQVAPAKVIPIDSARKRSRPAAVGAWVYGIAATLAIVALGAWNLGLQNDLAAAHTFQDHLAHVVTLGQQPGSQVAILSSPAGSNGPGGIGVMPTSGKGELVMTNLSPTSGNQVYEVWAIPQGGTPAPVGWFTVASDGRGIFENMPTATGQPLTVALTLEQVKDPPAPTTPVLASGAAVTNG